jgi:hypothetical protein
MVLLAYDLGRTTLLSRSERYHSAARRSAHLAELLERANASPTLWFGRGLMKAVTCPSLRLEGFKPAVRVTGSIQPDR